MVQMSFRGRRRGMSRPRMVAPIVSDKLYFQTGISILAGVKTEIVINQVKRTVTLTNDIATGTKVYKFIYLIITCLSPDGASAGSIAWYVGRRRAGQAFNEFPRPGALVGSTVRNQIIKSGLASYGTHDGGAIFVHKGALKIPKIYHRSREGDVTFIALEPIGAAGAEIEVQICYKVYQ